MYILSLNILVTEQKTTPLDTDDEDENE